MKTIAEMRDIRGYENMSKERLIRSINESKPVKEEHFDDARIKKIKIYINELIDTLSKPKKKLIRKNLYRIESK